MNESKQYMKSVVFYKIEYLSEFNGIEIRLIGNDGNIREGYYPSIDGFKHFKNSISAAF